MFSLCKIFEWIIVLRLWEWHTHFQITSYSCISHTHSLKLKLFLTISTKTHSVPRALQLTCPIMDYREWAPIAPRASYEGALTTWRPPPIALLGVVCPCLPFPHWCFRKQPWFKRSNVQCLIALFAIAVGKSSSVWSLAAFIGTNRESLILRGDIFSLEVL